MYVLSHGALLSGKWPCMACVCCVQRPASLKRLHLLPRVLSTLAEGRSEAASSALTRLQERVGAVCAEHDPAGLLP